MSTLTIIITAATFFLIGAGLGHLFARQNKSGDQSVQDLEKNLHNLSANLNATNKKSLSTF